MTMNGLIPKVYPLLVSCIETGAAHSVRRIEEAGVELDSFEAREIILNEVIDAICESFEIAQDGEDLDNLT